MEAAPVLAQVDARMLASAQARVLKFIFHKPMWL